MGLQIGSYKHSLSLCPWTGVDLVSQLLSSPFSFFCFLGAGSSSHGIQVWGAAAEFLDKLRISHVQTWNRLGTSHLNLDSTQHLFSSAIWHCPLRLLLLRQVPLEHLRLPEAAVARSPRITTHNLLTFVLPFLSNETSETGDLAHQYSDAHWLLITKDQNDQNQNNSKPLSSALHLTLNCLPCISEHFWN